MGLFEKKTDAVIVFVGLSYGVIRPGDEDHVSMYYSGWAGRLAKERFPGLPVKVWCFGDWTKQTYGERVLREVQENGFGAFDTGEKKKLFDEIYRVLALEYGVGVNGIDYSPACATNRSVFALMLKVRVKPSKL